MVRFAKKPSAHDYIIRMDIVDSNGKYLKEDIDIHTIDTQDRLEKSIIVKLSSGFMVCYTAWDSAYKSNWFINVVREIYCQKFDDSYDKVGGIEQVTRAADVASNRIKI